MPPVPYSSPGNATNQCIIKNRPQLTAMPLKLYLHYPLFHALLPVRFARQRKAVSAVGRSCGGPPEKFVGVRRGIFRSSPPQLLKSCLYVEISRRNAYEGQLLRSLLHNLRNFSEVAPEFPVVHTALSGLTLSPCPLAPSRVGEKYVGSCQKKELHLDV